MGAIRCHIHTARGVSLVEVMIALAVLTFGVYGVLDLYVNSHRLAQKAGTRTQALYLARARIAELEASRPADLFALAEKENGAFSTGFMAASDMPNFSWRWSLSAQNQVDKMLKLEISVEHTTEKFTPVVLHSYIFAEGE